MIRSVRTRLFVQMSAIILLFAAILVVVNTRYLESYYVAQERTMLHRQGAAINSLQTTDYTTAYLKLEEIEKTHSAVLLISDAEGRIVYSTNPFPRPEKPPLPRVDVAHTDAPPPSPFAVLDHRETGAGTTFEIQQDTRMNIRYLVHQRTLDTGHYVEIRIVQNVIQKNVAVANRFMLMAGSLAIAVALGWAYLFAKRFTQPLLQMNHVTHGMAELDFTRKCEPATQDEIGQLGHSINHLSERLDASLTELSQRNITLQQDIERERKLEKMRREFVSNVSHELKTPLAIIQGYAEGLRVNVSDQEETRNFYCDVIMEESKKMHKLINDLLDLSRLESGQFSLQIGKFNLTAVVHRVLKKYHTLFSEHTVTALAQLPEEIIVKADEFRIEQVFTNYLDNAINHAQGDKTVRISGEDLGPYYRLKVFNTGSPIAEDDIANLWTSFYKADKSRSREQGTYGLGLSIVKAVQELHGSAYGVVNTTDGVEFWFDIRR